MYIFAWRIFVRPRAWSCFDVHSCRFICCGHGPAFGMYYKECLSGPLCLFSCSAQPVRVAICDLARLLEASASEVPAHRHRLRKLFLSSSTVVSVSIRENKNKILISGAFDCLCWGTLFLVPRVPFRAPGERFLRRVFDPRKKNIYIL